MLLEWFTVEPMKESMARGRRTAPNFLGRICAIQQGTSNLRFLQVGERGEQYQEGGD